VQGKVGRKKLGRPPGRKRVPTPLREAIREAKRSFPTFGLKKVSQYLRRFRALKATPATVRRVVREEGLESLPPARKRPRTALPRSFERAKSGEMWQSDITSYVLTRSGRRVYLVAFVDDHSRYVVSWGLHVHQKGQMVIEALLTGIERHGKPKEVLTDQGRQYFTWRGKGEFQRLLEREGIEHVVSRSHHPETLGKCERLWKTVWDELWDRVHPQELEEARTRLGHYFAYYNHFRPHQGIGGMVPADRFFGAESEIRAQIEKSMAENELRLALGEEPRKPVYLIGQIGDQAVSLHGEKGELVMQTPEGHLRKIGYDPMGGSDGRDGPEGAKEKADRDAQADAGAGEGAVGGGKPGGEGACAQDGDGGAADVAGEGDEGGGGDEPGGGAGAGVAVEPAGGGGDGGGALEAAEGEEGGGGRGAGLPAGRSEGAA
jgi:transposase InsO family protein